MWVTGDYQVTFFNRYGARLKGHELYVHSYGEGLKKGHEVVDKSMHHETEKDCLYVKTSFTLDRRIFNSLDNR